MSTKTNDTTDDTDRFDAEIYDLDLWDDGEWPAEDDPCNPSDHAGAKIVVFAIGPNDNDVRKATMCSECGMCVQEVAYSDAHGIVLEGMGKTLDRVLNLPGEDPENRARIPIPDAELNGCDDPVVTTLQLDPSENEIVVGYTDASDE